MMGFGGKVVIVCGSLLTLGCTHPTSPTAAAGTPRAPAQPQFTDVTDAAGVRFRHTNGASGRLYFPETMGSGGGFLDYDGDGWQDLFLVNSTRLPGFTGKGPFHPALYRNRGDGTFAEVTREAGLEFECYGMGCAAGDYDGDGDTDLYVTAMGANRLFRNERIPSGHPRFADVTAHAGVGNARFSTSAAWVDYDRDGDLDLFVCNYCDWRPEINRTCKTGYGEHVCGPKYYPGSPSALYRNEGNGSFSDVTRAAGVYRPSGKALGVAVADSDSDGWPDLIVAHDGEANSLYLNRSRGNGTTDRRFLDLAVERGVAYGPDGGARAGMGIDTGDVTETGVDAIVIGNNPDEGLAFFRPTAGGRFTDEVFGAGLYEPSLSFLIFGVLLSDYDLDGDLDLLTANGHVDSQVEKGGGEGSFAQRLLVFRNDGSSGRDGAPRFVEVGASLGAPVTIRRVWRGLAWADYDRDGDPDFLVTACNGRPMLLRNETIRGEVAHRPLAPLARDAEDAEGTQRETLKESSSLRSSASSASRAKRAVNTPTQPHWMKVRLEGTKRNRQGLGSRVSVEVGGRRQSGWVRSGSSYCSTSEAAVLFGLGDATRADRILVRWSSGGEQEIRDVAADREIVVREK